MARSDCTELTGSNDGNNSEIERIFLLYHKELFVYLLRFTRSVEAAEDLLQDTFLSYIDSYSGKVEQSGIRPLLYKIAHNGAVDFFRRTGNELSADSDFENSYPPPYENAEKNEIIRAVDELLLQVDDSWRSIFYMKVETGVTYEEISQALGIPVRSVKRYMEKTLLFLFQGMKKKGFSDYFILFLAL